MPVHQNSAQNSVKETKIRNAIETILKAFENNPEKVALAIFKGNGKPSDRWSFFNRILMLMNDTTDARGFKQWQKVGRRVKKGAKAFYIIAPVRKKVPVKVKETKEIMNENGEVEIIETEKTIFVEKIVSFKPLPVFRYEDTEGDPLPQKDFNFEIPYEFNGIIEELSLKIETIPFTYCYGSYSPHAKVIKLASPELIVFLHELCHAVDDYLHNLEGDNKTHEVVAEFSACVIAYLMGYKIPLGNVKEYIEYYGFKELFKALTRVERIVNFVIDRTTRTDRVTRATKVEYLKQDPMHVGVY
jgi:hypothetical protein